MRHERERLLKCINFIYIYVRTELEVLIKSVTVLKQRMCRKFDVCMLLKTIHVTSAWNQKC
jgi:hypothetical protein